MFSVFSRCTTYLHSLYLQSLSCWRWILTWQVRPESFDIIEGCEGAFLQLLKCFFKLLARLMVLLHWVYFSFLIWDSRWCCLSAASFEKNLVHLFHVCLVLSIRHSIGCSICCISSSVAVNMAWSWSSVNFLLQCIVVDLI